ncbi:Target of rapamycin complex 1 subunit kog1, partial [Coemansia aciculifera]
MANVANGNNPKQANGEVATVTLGPARGNDRHPAIITTTATGANVELSELLGGGGDHLLDSRKPVNQTLLETRTDFHTHPRSLALAHMQLSDWRGQDKLRTVGSLLVACLHLGIEPPDSMRPKKSAVLEAWVDPTEPVQVPTPEELALQTTTNGVQQRNSSATARAPIKAIGENLLRQFEQLHRHPKYKPLIECVMEDLRKYSTQFRRWAKEERLMFYYNGHGVPRPTQTGDLWVFNRQYTQYIPVGTSDLMSWIGTPCIFIWDCSMAMNIVQAFEKNAKARELEIAKLRHVAEAIGVKVPISRSEDPKVMADAITQVTAALASSQTPINSGSGNGGGASFAPGSQQQQQQQQGQQQGQQQQQQQQQGQPPVNAALINLA